MMVDAYVNWISWRAKDSEVSSALSVDLLEWEFQKRLLISAFAHGIFLLGTSFVGIKRLRSRRGDNPAPSFGFFLNGMVVSLFAVVLKLPAVIWRSSSHPFDSMFWGCWMLQLISSRQVYMILSKTSECESFATVSFFLLCSLLFQTFWDSPAVEGTCPI
ncbi:hypothetical protein RvY_11955 [Ramazzottius varieornatus]|uniref:Uncharacterized protein n=1 Tax=Ramazzottius varieornatus TaxID=947166 RepID=A0A1D1VJW7_RAMVA|nr:hypothetical protein RvY_11955 [Ramazzottius varieornatus]